MNEIFTFEEFEIYITLKDKQLNKTDISWEVAIWCRYFNFPRDICFVWLVYTFDEKGANKIGFIVGLTLLMSPGQPELPLK